MRFLDDTDKSLEILLGGVVTTNQLEFTASYNDVSQTTLGATSAASVDGETNDTTPVTLIAAPAAGVTRHVSEFTVINTDTVAAVVTIQLNHNSTVRRVARLTLAPDHTLEYTLEGLKIISPAGFVYTNNNILGTVSQSGGVPTGALFERIENADGVALKYPDGTMKCYRKSGQLVAGVTANAFLSGTLDWADEFSSVPVIVITADATNPSNIRDIIGMNRDAGLTGTRILVYRLNGANFNTEHEVVFNMMAIGRWYEP